MLPPRRQILCRLHCRIGVQPESCCPLRKHLQDSALPARCCVIEPRRLVRHIFAPCAALPPPVPPPADSPLHAAPTCGVHCRKPVAPAESDERRLRSWPPGPVRPRLSETGDSPQPQPLAPVRCPHGRELARLAPPHWPPPPERELQSQEEELN